LPRHAELLSGSTFPKGKVRCRDLLTSFTDLSALLSNLKSEGFSGTIEMEFPENSGILFIDTGEIINAEAKGKGDSNRMVGSEAIQYLLSLSKQKDGLLNIYQFLPEQVATIAGNLQCEILFKELSTDFTRLDRLLLKLREEKHQGFIEVFTKNHEAMGVVFLQDGGPIEMFTTTESGPSVFGRKSIPTFVENAGKEGAIFNVYRTQGKTSKVEGPAPVKADDLKELLLIFQEVFSKVENLVDGISQKGRFLNGFKKALLEKADEYPFLDPFRGEFEYREGRIQYTGEVKEGDFSKGMIECLRSTLYRLAQELPKNKIFSSQLKGEITTSLKSHQETIKRLGIEAELSSMFQ
jgi:hypothetical protein